MNPIHDGSTDRRIDGPVFNLNFKNSIVELYDLAAARRLGGKQAGTPPAMTDIRTAG